MNKFILLFVLLFFSYSNSYCQTFEIEGFAFNTFSSKKRKRVSIVVNDTLLKLLKKGNEKKLKIFTNDKSNWKKYLTSTNRKGKFKIKANIKDSLIFKSNRHKRKSFLVSDLIKLDKINIELELINCDDYKCKSKPKLLIVTGQKISFETKEYNYCTSNTWNSEWSAEYRIDTLLHGNYSKKSINYEVSLHASRPSVQKYTNVILYLKNLCDKYYMHRGGFDAIYKTKNGKWATTYSGYFLSKMTEDNKPKPVKLDFIEPVIINFHESWDDEYISKRWFEPYYTVNDRKAIANYGFYLEDAVKIKKAYFDEFYD